MNTIFARLWEKEVFQLTGRILALFFGTFTLVNLTVDAWRSGFDETTWWVDLRVIPGVWAKLFLLAASLLWIGFALWPAGSSARRKFTASISALTGLAALWNVLEFYALAWRGSIHPGVPVPLSLLVIVAMGWITAANLRTTLIHPQRRFLPLCFGMAVCAIAFPVLQMICFGETDYRRSADVAVVFGARTYKDGHPSDALRDRVRTACDLYRQGLVRALIFSGGPGDGRFTETDTMRRLALAAGVRPEDIQVDNSGLNTSDTVKNTTALFGQMHARKILVVSHFYHLPRIKLAYQRAGWEVCTVPARQSRYIWKMPYFMAREVAADWAYYFRV